MKNKGKVISFEESISKDSKPSGAKEELKTKDCEWAKGITCLKEDSCWDGCLHNPTNQCYKRCDAKRVMVRGEAPEMWWVRCQGCRVIGPCMKTPKEALEAWNNREERIKTRVAIAEKKELKQASPWISVEDRLPEEGQIVIVGGGMAQYRDRAFFTGMEEPLYKRRIQWIVTHWMLIPELPK